MRAARKAYEVIRNEIIEGHYAPGDRITEAEIVESAEVSRTPVREALHRLEAEGLIRFVPNQGAFVSSWGEREAEDIFELRAMLESYAARLCAQRANLEQLQTLQTLAEEQLIVSRERKSGFLKKIADLNTRFHEIMLITADSELLRGSIASLSNAPLVFQTFRDYSQTDLIRSAEHHLELVEALKSRNADWAESVMRAHIFAARSVFRQIHRRDDSSIHPLPAAGSR